MVSILVERAEQRDALRAHLARAGIETRPLFYPVHTMPMYAHNYRKHRVAEDLAWRGINLPSWPGLGEERMQQVVASIKEFYGHAA
jgi:perosamine synthetase